MKFFLSKRSNTFSWRRILGLVRKEGYQIVRDPSSILIAFVLPIILIFLSGYAFNLDSTEVRFGVVVENPGPVVNDLANAFQNSTSFHVTIASNRQELRQKIIDGELRGVLIIPEDFVNKLNTFTSEIPQVQLITDGSEPNIASLVFGYVQGTLQLWLSQYRQQQGFNEKPPITLIQRIWFNENALSRHSIIPGTIAIILTVIGTLLTALVVAREWERGTMEAILVTPLRISEIVIGKIFPYYILGLGSLLISFASALYVFDVPYRGSYGLLFLTASFYLSATLSLGLLISTAAKNQFIASQTAIYTAFLPAFFLSGFIFEINSIPSVLQGLSYLLPPRYFVNCMKTLFLSGSVTSIILYNSIGILTFTTIMVLCIRKKLKKSLESSP